MKFTKIIITLFSLLLAGCTTVQSGMCSLRGGEPYVNLGGYAFCGKKHKDAGNTCRNSEECEGDCVLPWSWNPDEEKEVIGKCEADTTLSLIHI